jgi:hypothetical protein
MIDKKNCSDHLEKLMNQLADSVLGLSDEAICAEASDVGADLEQEAERTRLVLRQASKILGDANERLANLGHTISSNDWVRGKWSYYNRCLDCRSFVSFTTAAGEVEGDALERLCPAKNRHQIRRQEASRE